jgi:tetracycline 7-halogenase / FADH2 O2-dependent halogenase
MSKTFHADVAIIGSGFGGSLLALILRRIGYQPLLIERARHPRFALGESSTPIADLVWQQLCRRYDLPRLLPFGEFGTWQKAYPKIPCGLKRGFGYFHHQAGGPFVPRNDHSKELLVAASAAEADADTHWLRADFDAFIAHEAQAAGVAYWDQTTITSLAHDGTWNIQAQSGEERLAFSADFVVDASGEGCLLARALKLPQASLATASRAVYGHFTDVRPWRELFVAGQGRAIDHPFPCDDAALHHVFDGGWMWVLRFNNGITSAGLMLDTARHPAPVESPSGESAAEEWKRLLSVYPSIAQQFAPAQIAPSCGGLRRTNRLQRRALCAASSNWAMLPLTAYSLDALHSTGNAHTLCGIERLATLFEQARSRPEGKEWARELAPGLARYDQILQSEIDLADEIVHGCYAAFSQFEFFTSFSMAYFTAATFSEAARRSGSHQPDDAFLLAHDRQFVAAVRHCKSELLKRISSGQTDAKARREYAELVAQTLHPWNIAGLCNPARNNMYPFVG